MFQNITNTILQSALPLSSEPTPQHYIPLFCNFNSPVGRTKITHMQIKHLPLHDRPREKLLAYGIKTLSDSELLAILLGSGTRDESAVGLAQRILSQLGNNLHALARLSVMDLQKFKGVGQAKAITISAALEIGRRRQLAEALEKPQLKSSMDAHQLLAPYLADLSHEEFWVIMLNRSHRVIHTYCASRGGVTGTVVDSRMIFKEAVQHLSTAIIIAHNHPSGNLKPSQQDKALTSRLKEAGKVLEIQILDHLIVTSRGYYSFADEGVL